MDISVVIPNYNGENILKKNLPKVIEVFNDFIQENKKQVEIIIIDDFSQDASRKVIEDIIRSNSNNAIKIKSFYSEKNYGFSSNVNKGVASVEGKILILLNTDVIPKKGFLDPLLARFKDEKVFAVGCMDESVEKDKIVLRGRGVGKWVRGFLIHERGNLDKDNTLWVSGGSGAFNREIWQKLGGLNELYNPFYWEDIDLSYRALKSGYKIFFEKQSVVRHEHETGSIKSKFTPFDVKTIAYRNQFLFVWENATDYSLQFSHLFWLPYHFIKAILRADFPFLLGFLKALMILPKIIKSSLKYQKLFIKKDSEIINELNK